MGLKIFSVIISSSRCRRWVSVNISNYRNSQRGHGWISVNIRTNSGCQRQQYNCRWISAVLSTSSSISVKVHLEPVVFLVLAKVNCVGTKKMFICWIWIQNSKWLLKKTLNQHIVIFKYLLFRIKIKWKFFKNVFVNEHLTNQNE